MLKNVAGGRFDVRSEPGMKSAESPATTVSSAANEADVAQILVQRISPAKDANERSRRNFRRGIMSDAPFWERQPTSVRRSASPFVIGTQTAVFAAYGRLKRLKGEGN